MLLLVRRLGLALVLLAIAAVAWFFAQALQVKSAPMATSGSQAVVSNTSVLSTSRLAPVLANQPDAVDLAALLADLQTQVPERACAVVRWGDSELVSIRAETPLAPGFAQLFFTGFAALEFIGPDATFTTRVVSVTETASDARSLVLIGGGDPVLQTTEWALQRGQSVWTSFEVLADEVVAAGVTNIDGGIVVVDDRYDAERTIPGWSADWPETRQIGALGALQVNDGWIGGELAGDPGLAANQMLATLLADRGTTTTGPIERRAALADIGGESIEVGQVTSAPLRAIVRDMWHQGDPTTAELLLKETGLAANGSATNGSSAAGGQAVGRALATVGVDLPLSPRDGSGLDPTAQVTCQTLVDTLAALPADHPAVSELAASNASAFNGQFRDNDLAQSLALVGGGDRNARGIVGRAETPGGTVTFATLVNNGTQLTVNEVLFQTHVVDVAGALVSTPGSGE